MKHVLVALLLVLGPVLQSTGEVGPQAPVLVSPPEASSRATSYVNEDVNKVTIGNDLIELELDKAHKGGLDRIIDKATGNDHRSNKVPPPMMFLMMLWNGTGMDVVVQWDALTVDYGLQSGGDFARVTINYHDIKGYDLNATVTITVHDGSALAKMRMDVVNDDTVIIKFVSFPVVWGMGAIGTGSDDDSIFYPAGDGLLVHDPISHLQDLYWGDIYPGSASIQLMAHYDPDGSGLYMATYDTNGHPKELLLGAMEWNMEQHMMAQFKLFVPEGPGNDLTMDYDAVLGTFHGDWYEAAAIYKGWAETTPFVSGGKVFEDKDIPEWYRNTTIIQMVNRNDPAVSINPLSDIVNITREFSDLTGLNTTVMIHGWEGNGAWVGPYYYPPAEGGTAFKDAMDALAAGGDRGFIYISGTVWRVTRDDTGYADHDLFNSTGLPWVALNESGQPFFDPFYESLGWHSARMDPMTDFWQDMVVDNAIQGVDLGVQVVQVDEFPIGAIYPCYNASHGHPVGYTNNISMAYRSMLQDIRADGRAKDPDLIVSIEEPNEYFLPYIDSYVSRDNAPESLLYGNIVDQYGDDAEFVPFFSFVYHEYATSFGEHLPVDNDYPSAFTPQVARSLARILVTGELQNAVGADHDDIRPGLLELYNRSARATGTYANEYLIEGVPLVPPTIDVPSKEVQWYNYYSGLMGTPVHEPAVMNSAWRADDGEVGHVLVNWDTGTHTFDIELPLYDLPDENHSIMMIRNGERSVLVPRTQLPVTVSLTMDQNDVILLETAKMPDLSVGDNDLVLEDATPLTDREILVNVTVHNTGTLASGPFEVSFCMNGTNGTGWVPVGTNRSVAFLDQDAGIQVGVVWNTTGLIGEYELSVAVDGDDHVLELDEDNNTAYANATVLPRPRSDLIIKVLDNRSPHLPLENATVELLFEDGNTTGLNGTTNLTGDIRFDDLVARRYTVHVNLTWFFVDQNVTVDLPEGVVHNITIYLDIKEGRMKYPVIMGTVTDPVGRPLAGTNVTILDRWSYEIVDEALTNMTGDYRFNNVPTGQFQITACVEDHYIAFKNLTVTFYGTVYVLDFVLEPIPKDPYKGEIKGWVTDESNGEPIENVVMTIDTPQLMVQTEEDGEYLFIGLFVGNYTVNASLEDFYYPQEKNITVKGGEVVFLNFTLERRKTPPPPKRLPHISGNVMDKKGRPIEGALVEVLNWYRGPEFMTDGNGRFLIPDIEPDIYTIKVSKKGYVSNVTTGLVLVYNGHVDLTMVLKKRFKVEQPEDDPWTFSTTNADGICLALISLLVIAIVLFSYLGYRRWKRKRAGTTATTGPEEGEGMGVPEEKKEDGEVPAGTDEGAKGPGPGLGEEEKAGTSEE